MKPATTQKLRWSTACLFSILPFVSAPVAVADEAAPPLLADAIKAITEQEHSVNNLKASGTLKTTRYEEAHKEWVPDGEWDVTEIFDGIPGGKYRIECHKALIPWLGGPSAFEEEAFTAVYNGKVGMILTTKEGERGPADSVPRGTIEGKRATNASSAAGATEWSRSIFGIGEAHPGGPDVTKRFSEVLADGQKIAGFHAEPMTQNDQTFLRVSIPQSKIQGHAGALAVYRLDPKKGYGIARFEWCIYIVDGQDVRALKNVAVLSRWDVKEWWQPAQGIFYPKQVHLEAFTLAFDAQNQPKPQSAIRMEDGTVTDVRVNDPAVTPESYQLNFPEGTNIEDSSEGKIELVTGTPEEQHAIVQEQITKAEQMVEVQKMAAPGNASQPH